MVLTGTVSSATTYNAIPIFAPAYRPASFPSRFSDMTCLVIKYRTDGQQIRALLPDNLAIEEQPIITTRFIYYGCSPIGPYHEFIQSVEVTFNGSKYDYSLLIILDNEDAAYSGRELWGAPKVMGSFEFPDKPDGVSGFFRGNVSRPVGHPIAEILFKPTVLLPIERFIEPELNSLFLRIIPSPMPEKTPHIRQFTEVAFKLEHTHIWEGVASIGFPAQSMFDPLHLTHVEEYISAHYAKGSSATISPVNIHDF
ncbi:acetoacetate decarboxylase-like protein [Lindgomyces ingoldianus]|uniref:Acetoacetate decarboxylase-like protein n=1 Tax=Lindgomyces ingoldianus TaxID=673940 RepID=A0ACB6QBS4_9PLEO|nr:acetoacetate decarboxylase-like protein [Lindgomyces ingoldianus]KAF2464413.1 acetoacetate decarboxylase-like protein [Lindgomyces ingoldianus]